MNKVVTDMTMSLGGFVAGPGDVRDLSKMSPARGVRQPIVSVDALAATGSVHMLTLRFHDPAQPQ